MCLDFDHIEAVVERRDRLHLALTEEAGPDDRRPDAAAVGPVVGQGGQQLLVIDQLLLAEELAEANPLQRAAKDGRLLKSLLDGKTPDSLRRDSRSVPRRRVEKRRPAATLA